MKAACRFHFFEFGLSENDQSKVAEISKEGAGNHDFPNPPTDTAQASMMTVDDALSAILGANSAVRPDATTSTGSTIPSAIARRPRHLLRLSRLRFGRSRNSGAAH